MATAWVTEYADAARVFPNAGGAVIPAGQEPALTVQSVTYTTATESAAFNSRTRMVRVYTSADARVAFGDAPVAVAGSTPVTGKVAEFFGVAPGQKISIYDGTS